MRDPQQTVDAMYRSWEQLCEQYSKSCEVWNDEKLRDFNNRYWSQLEPAIHTLLQTASEIAQAISESKRTIPDE